MVHGASSRPVLTFFDFSFFSLFFKLKIAYNAFFLVCNTITKRGKTALAEIGVHGFGGISRYSGSDVKTGLI